MPKWMLVRLADGAEGWVANADTWAKGDDGGMPLPELAGQEAGAVGVSRYSSVVWPDAGSLNLRAGPGTSYDVLPAMHRGDRVSVVSRAASWVTVEHDSGTTGWASKTYLTR